MLDRGVDALLAAPVADFSRELERMHLMPAKFQAVIPTNDYTTQTIEADLADLRGALRKTELTKAGRERIVSNYQIARAQLASSRADQAKVDGSASVVNRSVAESKASDPALSGTPGVLVPDGLPGEFADYFRGSIAWHAWPHQRSTGRLEEALLERPEKERHYRSTWAAYMLGKCRQGVDEEEAIHYFQKVRALAGAGFADRLGLAAASLGWEAHEELHLGHFDRAIQLYLQQLASGDDSAAGSLRIAAGQALGKGGDQLSSLAANVESRRLITAYLYITAHERLFDDFHEDDAGVSRSLVVQWLDAVEAADVNDMESAEQLALAAYQSGRWNLAQRWIQRAKTTPVTEWLQAEAAAARRQAGCRRRALGKGGAPLPIGFHLDEPSKPVGLEEQPLPAGFLLCCPGYFGAGAGAGRTWRAASGAA